MPVHAQLNGLYTAPADPTEIRTFRPVGSHLGDKTSEWWLARDQDVFVLMHNALRGEVTKLESVLFTLGDKTLKEWEIQAIRVRRRVAFVRSRGVYTCASTTTAICVRSFFPSRRARATPAIGVDARAARDRARARCRRAPSLSRDARGGGGVRARGSAVARRARCRRRRFQPTVRVSLFRSHGTLHPSVSREFSSRPLSPLAAAAAQDHWTGHYESLKEHFKIEDEIMHPFVKTRVDILGDAFRESHEELAELAHAVDRYSLR